MHMGKSMRWKISFILAILLSAHLFGLDVQAQDHSDSGAASCHEQMGHMQIEHVVMSTAADVQPVGHESCCGHDAVTGDVVPVCALDSPIRDANGCCGGGICMCKVHPVVAGVVAATTLQPEAGPTWYGAIFEQDLDVLHSLAAVLPARGPPPGTSVSPNILHCVFII